MTLSADTLKVSQIKDITTVISTEEKTVVEQALTKALTARAKDLADALPELEAWLLNLIFQRHFFINYCYII